MRDGPRNQGREQSWEWRGFCGIALNRAVASIVWARRAPLAQVARSRSWWLMLPKLMDEGRAVRPDDGALPERRLIGTVMEPAVVDDATRCAHPTIRRREF